MYKIGHTYALVVARLSKIGAYLQADNLGEVLLPKRHTTGDLQVGDSVFAFLYLDSEDRLIATTQKPKAEVGQFAYLEVAANTDFGTFLDWGLDKDLLVPFGEQHRPMEVGQSYIVYLYVGENDERITASSKIEKFLDDERPHNFKPRQQVDLLIANTTELGYRAIVNNSHWGVLYKNEVFQRLSFGQSKQGYIKYIRPDGKLDLSLQTDKAALDGYSKTILAYLEQQGGFAPVHDKSDPDLIKRLFGLSKKAFKKSIGTLYKQKIIVIEKDGIRLAKDEG